MILRVVLAVVLSTALLAVVTPAMADAGADRADSTMERQFGALEGDLGAMVETDDPTAGPGARHVVELRLPGRSLTSAAVDRVRLYSRKDVTLAAWRVGDDGTSHTRLAGVPVRTAGDGALTLHEPGSHRLVFELRSLPGGTLLRVRRLGGETDA